MIFYVMVTIVSAVAFTIDIILRYMEKIRSFGMESRLHNIKGRIIPTEDFIPHTYSAIRTAAKYQVEGEDLPTNIGSDVYILVRKLIK